MHEGRPHGAALYVLELPRLELPLDYLGRCRKLLESRLSWTKPAASGSTSGLGRVTARSWYTPALLITELLKSAVPVASVVAWSGVTATKLPLLSWALIWISKPSQSVPPSPAAWTFTPIGFLTWPSIGAGANVRSAPSGLTASTGLSFLGVPL